MATRKCSKCGWEVAATSAHSNCPICGRRFTEGPCIACGTYVTNLVNGKYCVKCHRQKYGISANTQRWRKEKRRENDATFEEWLGKIKLLPSDYPTLTQMQWLSACTHFNGCAYCGSESIDAQTYFIPFKLGGRYCDWNIIPACEKCATRIKGLDNPFAYLEKASERQALLSIIGYLEERLNAAVDKFAKLNK